MFTVVMTKRARKEYDRLPSRDRERIENVIDELQWSPFAGKKLSGDHEGYWSVRAWPYRVIYSIHKEIITVTVVSIGHRKDVYEKLRR